jgi:hypothetical protein
MSTELLKKEFVPKYTAGDESKFYRFLLSYATKKLQLSQTITLKMTPEVELLEYYNQFLFLYRREGDEDYLKMARLFRKASHKIYRVMLKHGLTSYNINFLNAV